MVTVVNAGGGNAQGLLADQRPTTTVEQAVGETSIDIAIATGHRAVITVIEIDTFDLHPLPAGHQAALVAQLGGIQDQALVADQLAVVVVQRASDKAEVFSGGNLATQVVQVPKVLNAQRTAAFYEAILVVQVARGLAQVNGNGSARE